MRLDEYLQELEIRCSHACSHKQSILLLTRHIQTRILNTPFDTSLSLRYADTLPFSEAIPEIVKAT